MAEDVKRQYGWLALTFGKGSQDTGLDIMTWTLERSGPPFSD